MKLKDIASKFNIETSILDLENMFDISLDKNRNYRYNLNETIYFQNISSISRFHIIRHDMFWSQISYDIYGTVRLAWLLMKLNKVTDPFEKKVAGTYVIYIDKNDLQKIIASLNRS